MLPSGAAVGTRVDVDILSTGLGEASHLEAIHQVPAFVGPRNANAVDAVARRGRGSDLSVQEVDILGRDRAGPGAAEEALEGAVVVLPHLLVQDDDVGEAIPDGLPEHGARRLRRLPQRLGADGGELVEVPHEHDDGKGTQHGGGVLRNRTDLAALFVDGVQHGQTDHADLVNKQSGPPLPQGVDLRLDRLAGAIEDVDRQGSMEGAATDIVGGSTGGSQLDHLVLPLQEFEAALDGLDDPGLTYTTLARDREQHLVVGLHGSLSTVFDGMGEDLRDHQKLLSVERQSLPDQSCHTCSGRIGAQPGDLVQEDRICPWPYTVRDGKETVRAVRSLERSVGIGLDIGIFVFQKSVEAVVRRSGGVSRQKLTPLLQDLRADSVEVGGRTERRNVVRCPGNVIGRGSPGGIIGRGRDVGAA